jgi:hypothetical protein
MMPKLTLFVLAFPVGDQIFRLGTTLDFTPVHHFIIAILFGFFFGQQFAFAFYLGIEWRDGWQSLEGFDLLDMAMVPFGAMLGVRMRQWVDENLLPAVISRAIRS